MSEWLFVSGAGRTGTKLLAWCLAQHPQIEMCVHESNVALEVFRLFEFQPLPAPLVWQHGGGTREEIAHLFKYGPNLQVERPATAIAQAALAGMAERLAPAKAYLGDKSPRYTIEWPLLRELCPGCEIVFIDRELEATAQSWVKVGFATDADEARNEIIRRVRTAQGCPGARWLTLEELKHWPQDVLSKLLMDLGLDPLALPWERVVAQITGPARLD